MRRMIKKTKMSGFLYKKTKLMMCIQPKSAIFVPN